MISEWLGVEQGLRQGCVLALFLFNTFLALVKNVANTRLTADKDIMDAIVHLMKKTRTRGRGEATAGESAFTSMRIG